MDWSNLQVDFERLGSWAAVAKEYGVSKGLVSQHARKAGLTNRSRALAFDWSDLPILYATGMTYEQLTAHYGCSVHAIQNAMKRLNVTPRPTGLPEGYEWTDERRAAHRAAVDRPEWRAKSRENLLKRLPTMRGPSANSPLERLIQAALVKAGISFSTQRVLLDRYCVDVLLAQAPVVIEADGALHHLRKEKDAQRDAALTNAGYRVFRFNGARINTDPDGCIAEVVEACGLAADAEPVADIRNRMVGAENPNWRGGEQPMQCTQCGATFHKVRSARSYGKTFCSSECYGAWLRDNPQASNRLLKIDWTELPALYAGGMTIDQLAVVRVRPEGCHRCYATPWRYGETTWPPTKRRLRNNIRHRWPMDRHTFRSVGREPACRVMSSSGGSSPSPCSGQCRRVIRSRLGASGIDASVSNR